MQLMACSITKCQNLAGSYAQVQEAGEHPQEEAKLPDLARFFFPFVALKWQFLGKPSTPSEGVGAGVGSRIAGLLSEGTETTGLSAQA